MKNITLLLLAVLTLGLSSCEDEDKTYFQEEAIVNAGGYLLTLDFPGNTFVLSDLANSTFEVTFEAHDYTSDSSKLDSVDVLVSLNGTDISDDERLLTTIPASAFTTNQNGYPEHTFISPALDAFQALSLDPASTTSADFMYYRVILKLTDGTSYSINDINPDLTGEVFFDSNFFYQAQFDN